MKSKLFAFFVLFVFLFINLVSAAKIYGDIYDLELNKARALVKINSTPEQRMLANGSYSFDVSLGIYNLEAIYREKGITYYASEIVKIEKEGNYRIDLILIPQEEEIFANDTELNEIIELLPESEAKEKDNFIWLIIALFLLLILVLLIILLYKWRKKKEKEMISEIIRAPDKFKKQVIELLKKEKRMLQKDLRKKLNVSEAKLSLLITELEEEGKVKKIKRGRGNILIWQE